MLRRPGEIHLQRRHRPGRLHFLRQIDLHLWIERHLPAGGAGQLDEVRLSSGVLTPPDFLKKVANNPPIADAGPDQSVAEGALVSLNGTASTDPEGAPLTYAWLQTVGVLDNAS